MEVSFKIWVPPNHPFEIQGFSMKYVRNKHYNKPSSLGIPDDFQMHHLG
jgi:hypothetical protein